MQRDHPFSFLRVTGLGARLNVTTSSAAYTLPVDNNGNSPRFHRLITEPTSSGSGAFCYVNIGGTSVTAQAGNICVTSNEQVILHTRGMTNIAVFHPSTTANVSIVPLEQA